MTTAPLFAGIGGHQSPKAKTVEWLTPPAVLNALGGADAFDLDPCSPADRPWPTARRHYSKRDNGLIPPWDGRVWLNPPYSADELPRWLARMADHGRGTALIFARTETDAFFRFVWDKAWAVLFIRGRLNFHHVDGARAKKNGGAPSVLCAYGADDADILAFCGIKGRLVPLRIPRSVLVAAIEPTWREALADWFTGQDGPVSLDDLYRAFATHPKARGRRHYREKLRQELQRGSYRNVSRGLWEATA